MTLISGKKRFEAGRAGMGAVVEAEPAKRTRTRTGSSR